VVKSRPENVYVVTKCGRRISPHIAESYTTEALEGFVHVSLDNMGLETIDLVQLHCPPTEVYYRPEIFALFDKLRDEGKIRYLGVSVEKVEEAIKAIQYPNVATVQIIFNMFRHRPSELFFRLAKTKNVGIIARVPLASGLLAGKMTPQTTFAADDHRSYNREGEAFDRGETFSGVDFELGLKGVAELKDLFPKDESLALWALRWVLMFDEVSCAIPGASRGKHVEGNARASDLPQQTEKQMSAVKRIYEEYVKDSVHQRW
jgi:aryl-alcohol dehydrogenase-like predicted oxidoreductase